MPSMPDQKLFGAAYSWGVEIPWWVVALVFLLAVLAVVAVFLPRRK
jgi:hypothetical protein